LLVIARIFRDGSLWLAGAARGPRLLATAINIYVEPNINVEQITCRRLPAAPDRKLVIGACDLNRTVDMERTTKFATYYLLFLTQTSIVFTRRGNAIARQLESSEAAL
jgi:hypothetical protein